MATLFSDDFNRANGNLDDDATWASNGSNSWSIATNQASNNTGGVGSRVLTTTTAHADVADCKVSVTRRLGANFDGGVTVRDDGAVFGSMTGYFLNVYGTNNVEVYRRNAGSETLLGSRNSTHAVDDVYALEISGTGATVTLKVYKNGVQQGADLTDSTGSRITAAGRCGIISFHSGDLFDDFLVEDLASGGVVNTQTLTDNVVVTDQPLDYVYFNRLLESPVAVTDEALSQVIGNLIITKILSSTVDVTDGALWFLLRNRQLTDSIDVTEPGVDTFTTTNLVMTDEVGVSDTSLVRRLFTRLLGDAIEITDALAASVIGQNVIQRVLTSAVETFDQAQLWLNRYRLGESVALTADEVRRVALYTRDLLDAIDVADQSLPAMQRFILLTDVLSVDDGFLSLVVGSTTDNPIIRIGFDQPRIVAGGYAI